MEGKRNVSMCSLKQKHKCSLMLVYVGIQVHDRGGWYRSYKDVPKVQRDGVLRSMFPSGKSDKDSTAGGGSSSGEIASDESAEEVEVCDLPLERCVRIVPHDQNTGGFFIAVLHKVSSLPGEF